MQNKPKSISILVIIIILLVIALVYVLLNRPIQKETIPNTVDNISQENQTNDSWKVYENKELGISFKYPKEFGDFTVLIRNGESGKLYTGSFQDNKFFTVGGITEDYTEGRGGRFGDFAKYLEESGKYYYLFALGKKYLIEPVKIINNNKLKILVVNDYSFVEERNDDSIGGEYLNPGPNGGALINLNNNAGFNGLAIKNSNINILNQNDFEKILMTFKSVE